MSTLPLFLTCLLISGVDICLSTELTSNRLKDRFTRQTEFDRGQCSALFRLHSCSTGLQQVLADAYSQYGLYREAYMVYVGCTRQENGDLCARSRMDESAIFLARSNCQSSLPLSSNCSEHCRQAIGNLAGIGCCVNSIYNISTDIFDASHEGYYAKLFQNNLWARCGVQDLGICRNDVEIQVRESDQVSPGDVNIQTYAQISNDVYCDRENVLPVLNALRNESDDRCYNFTLNYFSQLCGQKTDGTFCNSVIYISEAPAEIRRQCDMNADLSTNCSCTSSCRDAIQSFRNEFECCVDRVNRSHTETFATNGQLWGCCGVETVDARCMDTITSESPAEGLTASVVILLIAAFITTMQ